MMTSWSSCVFLCNSTLLADVTFMIHTHQELILVCPCACVCVCVCVCVMDVLYQSTFDVGLIFIVCKAPT